MTMLFRNWSEPWIARRHKWPAAVGGLRSNSIRRIVAKAKKSYPTVVMFAIFVVLVAATIALRLAIWLPISYRH